MTPTLESKQNTNWGQRQRHAELLGQWKGTPLSPTSLKCVTDEEHLREWGGTEEEKTQNPLLCFLLLCSNCFAVAVTTGNKKHCNLLYNDNAARVAWLWHTVNVKFNSFYLCVHCFLHPNPFTCVSSNLSMAKRHHWTRDLLHLMELTHLIGFPDRVRGLPGNMWLTCEAYSLVADRGSPVWQI